MPPSTTIPRPAGATAPHLVAAAAVAATLRPGVGVGPTLRLAVGAGFGPAALSVEASVVSPRVLTAVDGATLTLADAAVVATWCPPGRVAPHLGALGGAGWRQFAPDAEPPSFLVGVAGATVGVRVRVGRWAVGPDLGARLDLAPTSVRDAGESPHALSSWELATGLTLEIP